MNTNNLTIKKMDKSSWTDILKLSVSKEQQGFIESSQRCLDDANGNAYDMIWSFYAVCLDDTIIGFAMHGRQTFKMLPHSKVWLDRFMIDEKYQGKGCGKKAMELIIKKLYLDYNCKRIYLSVVESNKVAVQLYESLGFKKTMFLDPMGERIMKRLK